MRAFQYLPMLWKAGIEVDVAPFFSDRYVRDLQDGFRHPTEVLSSYFQRMLTLSQCRRYDLLWIQGEMLPWLPVELEVVFAGRKTPFVIDYDDALFHYYDLHPSQWVRRLLGTKHCKLIRLAHLVVAGNDYLANYARVAGARCVRTLPTVIDLERYPLSLAKHNAEQKMPVVGWIGQRATSKYLKQLSPVLKKFIDQERLRVAAIGVDASSFDFPLDALPWSEETEVDAVRDFDIGVMPLVDDSFERGKCGYKLIQYMACGLPVVASPVGVNATLVEHGVNGFLASSLAEWEFALAELAADPGLRHRMGLAGRRKVEAAYCLQVTGPRLVEWLKNLKDVSMDSSRSS